MRKYNYFDDEPEELEPKKSIIPKIDLEDIAFRVRDAFDGIAHGEPVERLKELRELPNLKGAALKLIAFALFIVTLIVFILVFSHTISSQNKKNELFYTDAGKVCTDYITEYGSVKWETMDKNTYGKNMARMTGFCYDSRNRK